MTYQKTIPERRRILQSEVDVIRAALERAPVTSVDEQVKAAIDSLQVISRCGCGCASIDFSAPASEQRSQLLADGTGHTPRGGQVGVIVWGRRDAITGLEIYARGAGDSDLVLPVPASVIPW